ncbi:hypothetical protein T4E_4080 [Trichinella pseudospiralis]|uniref:Uncharacterized protein n=1 Tax=Trichinella pseudospiralis TaxID=6337 RepID=A0A0V0Y6B9_TRIPS|nr:hypothetical protein T4E_4080 [Trichinella pseudospiralis]
MFNRTTADGCTLVHGAELAGEDRFENLSFFFFELGDKRDLPMSTLNMRMNKVDKSSLNCIITLVSSSSPSRVFEVALICLEFHEIKRNQGKNEITKQIQLAVY